MASIQPGRTSKRRTTIGKSVVLRALGHRIIAQAWPKPRGLPKLPWQAASLKRFGAIQKAIKLIPAPQRIVMANALKRFLDKHRGVRGTAAIRERDWQTAIFTGRQWAPVDPQGKIWWTATVQADASDQLDWLEPRIGSMIMRTANGWEPSVNCKPGRYLQLHPVPYDVVSCPPASIPPPHLSMGGHSE